jgi:quinol monooxygenase YgiN
MTYPERRPSFFGWHAIRLVDRAKNNKTPGDNPHEETFMFHATIRILIPPKRRGEVLDILSSVAERSRFEEGCINSRVYQDVEAEPVCMLDQLWESGEDLERHLRSEEFRKVLLVLEMSLEPPEIRFEEILRTSGVETIEKARNLFPR